MAKISLLVFLAVVICCLMVLVAGRPQDLPADGAYDDEGQGLRQERDSLYASKSYKPSSYGKYPPVGPVRTFVKTDYNGNFKWGVRHIAGKGYGRK
ncbi:unnamed protein product [Notodromas monacha]|uniref:Uncharacterized protein n=1 Tax=Notodromas monacha TaxID=399045 RepID=A0A7R9BVB7_9CRUS|nr:unnamed protein product [Notodromas monacha]CAG0922436.1 unnamed protein product [Notodromas monacha]